MSHWNGYEDIFCNEDNGVNNLLAFQNGEEVLESVTFSDSQKKPGSVLANDVRVSIYHDGSLTEAALPKTDARVRPICMNDGNSNILDPSLSFVSEKEAAALAHPSMGMLPGPFSVPSTPMEKSKKIYAPQQFPAAWVMDIPLEQHIDKALEQLAEVSNSSPQRKYKFEDVDEGDKEPAVNIGSSTLQDKSCMNSTFIDDVSINAASFQQLQIIMDRLGVRTKLCIRDSLYRLARSAEQSHCYGSTNNISRASSPMRGIQGSKRPAELLGLSISTNEIERAVAYLLFHKTLGSGTGTADDSILLRTHIQDPDAKCKVPRQSA